VTVSRILCASFFATAVALAIVPDVSSSTTSASVYGHCMPQQEGDYTPQLMDRLSREDGKKVIPLPKGAIAIVPQDCVQAPVPDGVPVSAWNARWDCKYVDVSEESQYTLAEARAMEANGYTPAPVSGEVLNPADC
jgi:hypothetical protein